MKGYGPQGFRECQGDYRDEADREVASQPLYRFQQSRPLGRTDLPRRRAGVQAAGLAVAPAASFAPHLRRRASAAPGVTRAVVQSAVRLVSACRAPADAAAAGASVSRGPASRNPWMDVGLAAGCVRTRLQGLRPRTMDEAQDRA